MKQVQLNGVRGKGKTALVDDEDYPAVSWYKWWLTKGGYAYTTIDRKTVPMHRFIMRPRRGRFVDHIDRDKLNNQRTNLRTCTKSQNTINYERPRTKYLYRGVHNHRIPGYYQARICVRGKRLTIGMYRSERKAALAYNKAAKRLHGKFAVLNDVSGGA